MATSSSCFHAFREFDTITEGFVACEAEGALSLPFVVRASTLALSGVFKGNEYSNQTSWPSLGTIRKQLSREADVKGYISKHNNTIHMNGTDTLALYDDGSMSHNVVDSESTRSCTSLLSEEMIQISSGSRVDRGNWLAYVVSPPSNCCGQLHTDPPHGSNWQYLAQGIKIWYAVNKDFDVRIFDKAKAEEAAAATAEDENGGATNDAKGIPPNMKALSLLQEVYRCSIGPGDFISVPIHWAHSINTTTASIGMSGYTAVPTSMLSPRHSEGSGVDY